MDIGKELAEYKKQAIIEWRKKNRQLDMTQDITTDRKVGILNQIRSAAAIKYFSKNHNSLSTMDLETLIKHYDDITTILLYL